MNRSKLTLIIGITVLAAILLAFGPAPDKKDDGNILRVTMNSSPNSLDTGITWNASDWWIMPNVNNGLLTYKKASGQAGNELVPDIAEAMPEISADGMTYTFRIRKGVLFGPPLKREVLPSDFAYTFERDAKLPTQGAQFYSLIKGFDKVKDTKKGTVSGVVADDSARTLTFHLTRADATFLYTLALPFTFVVPKGTPVKDMSSSFLPATGPYMYTEFHRATGLKLRRNPNFTQWTEDTPTGNVDGIDIEFGVSEENANTRIMQGKSDLAYEQIPRAKMPVLSTSSEFKPYIHQHATSGTTYLWMNSTARPFNNVKVRQAVNWAIDRKAMSKISGGASIPSSTILPPNMPGYVDHKLYAKQDMKKAKALIAESGVTPGKLTLWWLAGPSTDTAQYVQAQLEQLGFSVRTRFVDYSSYYAIVGAKTNKTQIGIGSWGADFPEGTNFITVNLYGKGINPTHSNNLAWYSGQDAEIERINALLDLDVRAKAWGALDKKIIEDAAWAPYAHSITRKLVSKRLGNYIYHPVFDVPFTMVTVDGSGTNNSKTHEGEVGYEDEGGDTGEETES